MAKLNTHTTKGENTGGQLDPSSLDDEEGAEGVLFPRKERDEPYF